jgi:hypothetical protein
MAKREIQSTRQRLAIGLLALVVLAFVAAATPASAGEEYDPKMAGNPVRIAAYILSPVGVLIDYAIMRPAWWIGSHEPFKTIFGRT